MKLFGGGRNKEEAHDCAFWGMGTEMLHRAYGVNSEKALEAVKEEAQRLEKLLSRFEDGSDIARINAASGTKGERISDETFAILSRAISFSELSDGLFDITITPLVELWDYKNAKSAPSAEKIAETLRLVSFKDLVLNEEGLIAKLSRAGQAIDLGGIAKGYASDMFMEVFKRHGVKSAFSNIGGNVSTLGAKPDGQSFKVGIRHPREEGLLGAVETAGEAVVTSGDYERFFVGDEGKRYHHILSPKTGYPAEAGLISVTVVAKSAMDADALSTALFVAGLEKGEAILKKCPWAEAVLADSGMNVYITHGLEGRIEATEGIRLRLI